MKPEIVTLRNGQRVELNDSMACPKCGRMTKFIRWNDKQHTADTRECRSCMLVFSYYWNLFKGIKGWVLQ